MEEFLESEERLIKDMQQVILKNTSDLSDVTRSEVYSKFQALRYFYINTEEAKNYGVSLFCAAFYNPKDNNIYVIEDGKNKLNPVTLVHEMIHAITKLDKSQLTVDGKSHVGFARALRYSDKVNPDGISARVAENDGINEGATEYFASKFVGNTSTSCYTFFVHIISLLCQDLGQDEDKFKECYFSNDLNGVKELLKNTYHLQDNYLVDKLFFQLDVVDNLKNNGKKTIENIPLARQFYETLVKMKISKVIAESNGVISKENVFKYFSVDNYLNGGMCDNIKQTIKIFAYDINVNRKQLIVDLKDETGYRKYILRELADRMSRNDFSNIESLKYTNGKSLNKVMTMFNTNIVFFDKDKNKLSSRAIINLMLTKLHGENGKINLSNFSEAIKKQFITNVIYSPYGDEKMYEHFSPKDLIDYINSGVTEYNVFCNKDAIKYLKPCLKDLNQRILSIGRFQNAIKEAAEGKIKNDEDIDLIIDF